MNTRRALLTGAAGLAAASAVHAEGRQQRVRSIYLHGMVWNQQLPAPQNDWLLRLDAKADIPMDNGPATVSGFATMGDDFHDPAGSHAVITSAVLQGDQLVMTGKITESKNPALVGSAFRIEGKVDGTTVSGLTVTIGTSTFSGAGLLVVIAIIAILIA